MFFFVLLLILLQIDIDIKKIKKTLLEKLLKRPKTYKIKYTLFKFLWFQGQIHLLQALID